MTDELRNRDVRVRMHVRSHGAICSGAATEEATKLLGLGAD
jgi:hypothetical protein